MVLVRRCFFCWGMWSRKWMQSRAIEVQLCNSLTLLDAANTANAANNTSSANAANADGLALCKSNQPKRYKKMQLLSEQMEQMLTVFLSHQSW